MQTKEFTEFTIGEIASLTAGGTPKTSKEKFWGGGIPWMNSGEINLKQVFAVEGRITQLGLDKSSTKKIPANSVLVALAGQGKTRGTVAINRIELCTNQSIAAIMPDPSKVDPNYLYYNLDGRYSELRRLSTGDGGRGGLNLAILRSIKVNLPSLEEQRQIAGILSTWEKAINAYDRLIALKENQKHGVAQIMFSNVIDEVSFADVIDVTIGGTPSRANDLYWDKDKSTDNRWISIANMNSSFISDSTEYISDEGVKKSNVKLLPEGTVIFSFKLSLGKKAILEKACYTNEAIAGLVIKDDASLSRDYLFHALDFVDVNREIDQAVKGKTLNKAKLLRLKLPIMPLEEQQKVARVLNCAQKEIALLERKRDLLIKQKQGLMQQLLA